MVAVPEAVGVNVEEQLPLTSVQLGGLNVPEAPLTEKVTVPVGVLVGAGDVSATVAVQVDVCGIVIEFGVHDTVVVVVLRVTVSDAVPLPEACVASPLYVPVIV